MRECAGGRKRNVGSDSSGQIRRNGVGSVLEFIHEAAANGHVTTEGECLEALREAAERLGESPTKAQYEELGMTPASATIMKTVGGWNEAKEQAGLETFDRGATGIDILLRVNAEES